MPLCGVEPPRRNALTRVSAPVAARTHTFAASNLADSGVSFRFPLTHRRDFGTFAFMLLRHAHPGEIGRNPTAGIAHGGPGGVQTETPFFMGNLRQHT
jgi:hypothetical protein